ncbi:hypothetical protein D1007_20542 [Hordeum vulgare]|nr:hypothetical protein D1007_20542 [Hordeum vulgare]
MAGSSLSSSSRSSGTPPSLATVKTEPQVMSEHCRSHGDNLVIYDFCRQPSRPSGHLRMVTPKKEKELVMPPVIVKQEHVEMAADLDTGLKWSHDDYVWEEMERQRHILEEIAVRRRDHEEGDIIDLDDSDEETPMQTATICSGNLGQGCSKDDAWDSDDDDVDDGGDYTAFYELLSMN